MTPAAFRATISRSSEFQVDFCLWNYRLQNDAEIDALEPQLQTAFTRQYRVGERHSLATALIPTAVHLIVSALRL